MAGEEAEVSGDREQISGPTASDAKNKRKASDQIALGAAVRDRSALNRRVLCALAIGHSDSA